VSALVVLAVLVVGGAGFGLLYGRRARRRKHAPPAIAADLAERVRHATRAFVDAPPWQPSTASAPDGAVAVEAALIAGDPKRALDAAEAMLVAGVDARSWLGWALVANGQAEAALASGSDSALGAYVAARAAHLAFEQQAGARGAIPPLVTTADLAVMTLARGRGSAAWLQGAEEVNLSADQVRGAVAEHRSVTARCLGEALVALSLAPGWADAAYLVARLAVKAGLLEAGRDLFAAIAPRIAGRPDAEAFARDQRDLADPEGAVAAAKRAPVAEAAVRSRSLRVL
jgi:hypothetical protein